jgi:hypothetical protein
LTNLANVLGFFLSAVGSSEKVINIINVLKPLSLHGSAAVRDKAFLIMFFFA